MKTRQIEKQNWDKQKLEDQNFYNAIKEERFNQTHSKGTGRGYLFGLIEKKVETLPNGNRFLTMYLKRSKYTKLK